MCIWRRCVFDALNMFTRAYTSANSNTAYAQYSDALSQQWGHFPNRVSATARHDCYGSHGFRNNRNNHNNRQTCTVIMNITTIWSNDATTIINNSAFHARNYRRTKLFRNARATCFGASAPILMLLACAYVFLHTLTYTWCGHLRAKLWLRVSPQWPQLITPGRTGVRMCLCMSAFYQNTCPIVLFVG